MRAIVRENARPDVDRDRRRRSRGELREVTEEFLPHENRERPDYLEGIVAPPLAPSEAAPC